MGGRELRSERKDRHEVFNGSERHDFRPIVVTPAIDSARSRDYIDVGQCKFVGHFAEERGFLVIRLDESELDLRGPEF